MTAASDGPPPVPSIIVAAACLRDAEGRLLTVRKRDTVRFMLPGGKLEPGEDALTAAVRETREETGVEVEPGDAALLGRFVSPAANEAGQWIQATVYVIPAPLDPAAVVAAGEIVEIRWIDPAAPLMAGHDLAPMLAEHVLPALAGPPAQR